MVQIDRLAETQRELDEATIRILGSQINALKGEDPQLVSDAQLTDVVLHCLGKGYEGAPLRQSLIHAMRAPLVERAPHGSDVISRVGERYFSGSEGIVGADSSGRVTIQELPGSRAALFETIVRMVGLLRDAHHRTGWVFYTG